MGTSLAEKGKSKMSQEGSGARVLTPTAVDVVGQRRLAVMVSTLTAADVVDERDRLGLGGDSLSTREESVDERDDGSRWVNPKEAAERGRERGQATEDKAEIGESGRDMEYAILENAGDFSWDIAYRKDPVFRSIYKRISISWAPHDAYEIWADGTMSFVTAKGPRTCIPAALLREVLHITHDSLWHRGNKKMYSWITSSFYRPRLSTYVTQYVSRCSKYCVNKTSCTKLLGSLLHIDVPEGKGALGAFECVGMDFIVNLPKSRVFDVIMVVIDKLTRYGIFIPTTSNYTALSTANLFVQWVLQQG